MIDYDCLPEHMKEAAQRYIERGLEPGSFLVSIFANDLLGAISRADYVNKRSIHQYHDFLVTIPMDAKGSYEAVEKWIAQGGIRGLERS